MKRRNRKLEGLTQEQRQNVEYYKARTQYEEYLKKFKDISGKKGVDYDPIDFQDFKYNYEERKGEKNIGRRLAEDQLYDRSEKQAKALQKKYGNKYTLEQLRIGGIAEIDDAIAEEAKRLREEGKDNKEIARYISVNWYGSL